VELVNYTPWPHLLFERGDAEDRRYDVLVMQGAFRFREGQLEPLDEQPSVAAVDTYLGDPRTTGLERAGAVATRRPRSDVSVLAFARSPERRARWRVRLQVGRLSHELEVRGMHAWERDGDTWNLSEPEPCVEVPIGYERAFGGRHKVDDQWRVEPRNPIGTGFIPKGLDDVDLVYAPQIVAVDEPDHEPGKRYEPKGWAPIPGHFAPRSEHVGTIDEAWKKEQWPKPPKDFSDAFYQSAHPDLIYPGYLVGGEAIRVDGVTWDERPVQAKLPGFFVFVLLRLVNGQMVARPTMLDSLHLDLRDPDSDKHRAFLTWRLVLPKTDVIRRLEGRMVPLSQLQRAKGTPQSHPTPSA